MNQRTFGHVKVAMIPLLFGILYLVIPGKPKGPVVVATDPTKATRAIRPAMSERTQDSKENELSSEAPWPEFLINELENVDPFDRRMIFPELLTKNLPANPNDSDKQLLIASNRPSLANPLESVQVQAVFQSPQGITALVGERVVHIGDRLKDGTQVIGITPEQLIVESTPAH